MPNREKDTRVVEMQFDSKDFDKNIRSSQKTLEDFKKSLNFDNAAGQMQKTTKEISSMDAVIQGMAGNIQKLTNAFTGVGNLSTYIAQKVKHAWEGALNSVERFAKSMTTVQVGEGFDKYDKLLKSVQTIMNATGDSEEYVYGIMERLNHYTDETSYNFADMAQNIGKFTTAGIKLGDAESAMEGIANWAALSGQNAQAASRAMYNISQAMSADAMQKMDWKSIQNAGMDTRTFREEAIKAAAAVGTLVKKGDKYFTKKGHKEVNLDNFAETLQFKWFDKATMMEVFKTFADSTQGIGEAAYKAAQRCTTFSDALGAWKDMLSTGWMKSFEHIFGKLSDAMALFSGLCNKVSESLSNFVELRNGILEHWSVGGGRNSLWSALVGEIESPDGEVLFDGAYGLLDALQEVGNLIYEGFYNFTARFVAGFNKDKLEQDPEYWFAFLGGKLMVITDNIKNFTQKIRDFFTGIPEGADQSRFWMLESVVEAIYSSILLISQVFGGIAQFGGELIGQLQPAIDTVLMLISYISQLFSGDVENATKKNTIGNFFHSLAEALRPLTTIVNISVVVLSRLIAGILGFINQSDILETFNAMFQRVLGDVFNLVNRFLHSDIFQGIVNWIQNLSTNIPAAVQKIKEFGASLVTSFKQSKTIKNFWNLIKKTFGGNNLKEVWNNIRTGLTGFIKDIPSVIPKIKDALMTLLGKIGGVLDGFFGGIIGLFVGSAKADSVDEAQEAVTEAVIAAVVPGGGSSSSAGATTTSLLQKIRDGFHKIWDPIKNFFSEFFTKTIPEFFNSDLMQNVRNFFEGTNFKDLLGGAKDMLKWLAVFRTGSGLVSMGKGIKSVGKGIKVFGKNLKNLNLSNIFSNMFNISNIINSNNSDSSKNTSIELGKLGNQLLQIAAAIGILTYSAIQISKMKPDELKQAGIAVGALVAGLLVAGGVAKRFAGNGASLLGLAAAVSLLLIPLNLLQKMTWATLIDSGEKLGILVLGLAAAARLAKKVELKGMIGFAVAVNLLMIPLKQLMKVGSFMKDGAFDPDSPIFRGLVSFSALILVVAGAARLAKSSKIKGLISFAVAMCLLLVPIKKLAAMDPVDLAKGIGAIEILIMSIAGLAVVTNDKKITGLAGLVAAITALSAVGWLIGHTIDWTQALVGFGPIILMIGMMVVLFKEGAKLSVEQIKKLTSIFWAMSAMIAVLAGSVVALTLFDAKMDMVLSFFGGVILVLGAAGVMIRLAAKTSAKGIGMFAVLMGSLAVVMAVAGGVLIDMAQRDIDWDFILAFFGGLTLLVAAVGGFTALLGSIGASSFVGVAALAAALVAIMGVISWMVPILMGSIGEGIQGVSTKLTTVSGLLKDFFERTASIPEEQTDRTLKVFDSLKELILKFTGFGDHSKDIDSVSTQLNRLGTGLELFFINDDKLPDPESAMSFKVLQKFIDIGPTLSTFDVGSLPTQLLFLGTALGLFHTATAGIDTAEPLALTLLQGIFGQADNIEKFSKLPLETFTAQMTGLGGALSLYAKGAKEVTGMGEGEDIDVSNSVGVLKAVCAAISGDDGSGEFKIPENMPDSAAVGLFAGQLESLGNALSKFATAAKEMETDTTNAMALLKFLADIGGYLTEDNLGVTKVFTDNGLSGGSEGPLGQFALDIGALGTALSSFATNIQDADFSSGLTALQKLADINASLTKDNIAFAGAFDKANIHETALDTFSKDIGALGRALKSFATNVTMEDGTQADFDYALRAINFLTVMSTRLGKTLTKGTSLHSLIKGNGYTLGDLSDDVQLIGQALSDMSGKMNGAGDEASKFNLNGVMDAFTAIEKMVSIINLMSLTKEDGKYLIATSTYIGQLTDFFVALTNDELGDRNGLNGSFADQIANFAADLSKAFEETGSINESAVGMFAQIAGALKDLLTVDPKLDFEYPGQMIALGIATGIRNGESDVVNAAIEVVQAAIKAANETAEVGSPSRVFTELGQFMDQGLVNGLANGEGSVQSAAEHMMDGAIDRASVLMSLISQAMMDSNDLQPTITPVLDLSNITGAGGMIGSMFGNTPIGLNLTGALNNANAATADSGAAGVYVQNPTDLSGITSAIATLQTQLDNLAIAMGNMKIVLNTGVVAGGVTDDVDANIGMKNFYASRRN